MTVTGYSIIDTNVDTSRVLTRLKNAGIKTVIRYFARSMSSKVIRKSEFKALQDMGFRIGIVYEGAGDHLSAFSSEMGYRDALFSVSYGSDLGVPAGACIYFAVDFDASLTQIRNNIIPYFLGVNKAFEGKGYKVGVYGSGNVCRIISDQGLAAYTWVSCSYGWSGTRDYIASNKWNLLQKLPQNTAGIDTDPNFSNPKKPDIGDFGPSPRGNQGVADKVTPVVPADPSKAVPTGEPWYSSMYKIVKGFFRE